MTWLAMPLPARDLRRCTTLAVWLIAVWGLVLRTPWAETPPTSSKSGAQQTTRIVSLVPNLTEIAFCINAGDQIVGVSDFCKYPPDAKTRPAVGGLVNPSLEGVLRLRPTVVLLYRSQQDFASRLQQLGIRSELFQVDTLADLDAAIDRLGLETGHTSAAAALSENIRLELASIKRDANAAMAGMRPITGIVIVSRDPSNLRALFQASPGNFLGELFEIAGGSLAIHGGASISIEDVIRANPDIIVDMSGSAAAHTDSSGRPEQQPGEWSALSTVSAVKADQVYTWADPHAMLLGPSIIDTASKMKDLIRNAAAARGN